VTLESRSHLGIKQELLGARTLIIISLLLLPVGLGLSGLALRRAMRDGSLTHF
jgi:hypothetical protein